MRRTPEPRILVVEDDPSLRESMAEFLGEEGFVVTTAAGADEADACLQRGVIDLVVLDVMLPGEDGLSMCRRILAEGGPPVLMVTALGSTTARILGLETGAADYLPKPFEPRELVARIRAVLRRNPAVSVATRLSFSGLSYDPSLRSLQDTQGRSIVLTAGELRLLETFLTHPARLLDRSILLDLTKGGDAEPFDRAIDLAVSRLRRKLATAGCPYAIETVRGLGYRFVEPVTPS